MMCIRVRSCECDQCCRCYRNKGKDRCCSCSCIHVNSKVEIFFIQSWFNLNITKFVELQNFIYDLVVRENGKYEYIKGFSYPLIGDEVFILNAQTVADMYNKKVLDKARWHIKPCKF